VVKRDDDEAAGEDTGDDEGDTLTHVVSGATKGTGHEGARER
jgi:hypothetical protein